MKYLGCLLIVLSCGLARANNPPQSTLPPLPKACDCATGGECLCDKNCTCVGCKKHAKPVSCSSEEQEEQATVKCPCCGMAMTQSQVNAMWEKIKPTLTAPTTTVSTGVVPTGTTFRNYTSFQGNCPGGVCPTGTCPTGSRPTGSCPTSSFSSQGFASAGSSGCPSCPQGGRRGIFRRR